MPTLSSLSFGCLLLTLDATVIFSVSFQTIYVYTGMWEYCFYSLLFNIIARFHSSNYFLQCLALLFHLVIYLGYNSLSFMCVFILFYGSLIASLLLRDIWRWGQNLGVFTIFTFCYGNSHYGKFYALQYKYLKCFLACIFPFHLSLP